MVRARYFQRTGLDTEKHFAEISALVESILKKPEHFDFMGFYAHCGHSYSHGIDVKALNKDAVEKLVNLKTKIQNLKIDGIDKIEIPVIGTGSTPGKILCLINSVNS